MWGKVKPTVNKIRALKKLGFYGDGNTLFMRAARDGFKQWVQRLVIHGKCRDIGLGGLSWVTLDEAREMIWENRRMARRGGDPIAAARRSRMPIFRNAAQRAFESLRPRWRMRSAGLRALTSALSCLSGEER